LTVTVGTREFALTIDRKAFDDLIRASLIAQDGAENEAHQLVFRLTADGRARGAPRPSS
jgi:hypothetical protein